MFELLNAIYLATTVAAQSLTIVANASDDVHIKQNTKVYQLKMRQQAPMWADHCMYDGVMVEYARDWAEVQESTEIVLPPEPDKPIGYALILTKEKCPNKPERKIFNVGNKFFYPFFGKEYVVRQGHRVDTLNYYGMREDMRPRWMPQVLNTIESEGQENAAASEFVTEMRSRAESGRMVD